MKDLSIIIISYNTKDITKKCLDTIQTSLSKSTINTEIIVVDNNSTDGSIEMLQEYKKELHSPSLELNLMFSKENLGFSKGNNLAAKQAQSEVLLFLNSDIEVLDDAIATLYSFFTKQKDFHFAGAKLFNKNMSPQASAGPFFSLPIIFAFLFLRGDYYGWTRYSPNTTRQVDWVSGACFITTKEHFEKVKGFDEGIFMYMDEIDLFYRAAKLGMKVGFYPDARFIHLGSASSQARTQPILQVYRGYIYFYKKHHSRARLHILKNMLQLKAVGALFFGKVLNNNYLIKTYAEALKIAQSN